MLSTCMLNKFIASVDAHRGSRTPAGKVCLCKPLFLYNKAMQITEFIVHTGLLHNEF